MIRALEIHRSQQNAKVSFHPSMDGAEALARPNSERLRWIDIEAQTKEEMELVQQAFQFHPLTIEDCLRFDQRPKIEEYPGNNPYLFLVIHYFSDSRPIYQTTNDTSTAYENDRILRPQPLRMHELHAYLGPNYLVTIHKDHIEQLDTLFSRVQGDGALFQKGCDFLYYLVADHLCDVNFPVLEHLSNQLDEIEEQVIGHPEKSVLSSIYEMRKTLVTMRRALSPQRDLMALLSRHGGSSYIQPSTALYFRDVYDHLVRINEAIESARDLLGNCVDAYLSSVGQRTNEIMKQLTILSAIMLPLTFIVGFFGMNFQALPFHSSGWFIWTLVLTFLIIPCGMIYWFQRKQWI